jgi:hypothetical protein
MDVGDDDGGGGAGFIKDRAGSASVGARSPFSGPRTRDIFFDRSARARAHRRSLDCVVELKLQQRLLRR